MTRLPTRVNKGGFARIRHGGNHPNGGYPSGLQFILVPGVARLVHRVVAATIGRGGHIPFIEKARTRSKGVLDG